MFSILAGIALKSIVLLGAAHLIAVLLRRRSAASRHILWTSVTVALLALPFLSLSLPALRMPAGPTGALFQATGLAGNQESTASLPPSRATQANPPLPARFHPDWRLLVVWLWAAGAALFFTRMILACAQLSLLRRRAKHLEYRNGVRVLEIARGGMPMTFGVLRPTILLPADFQEWSGERRRLVLLHEMAHVRRGDAGTQLLARFALCLYWWNPLSWTAWKAFLKEREYAADDLVLQAGADAPEYAGHLLAVARAMRPADAWASVTMARQSQLEGRLRAILRSEANRKAPGRAALIAGVLLALAAIAPLAAVRAQESTPLPDVNIILRTAAAQQDYESLDRAEKAFEAAYQYSQAEQLLQAALTIRAQTAGAQSGAYAAGLVNLGDLARRFGKNDKADAYYTSAVALEDRPEVASALLYLAIEAYGKKNPNLASQLIERAEKVNQAASLSGPLLTWSAVIQNGAPTEALLRQALAQESPSSPDAALTMEIYAHLLPNAPDASAMDANAGAIRKSLITAGTPKLPDATPAVRITPGITTPPKIVYKGAPAYSPEARALKIQGTAAVSLVVGPDGKAYDVQLIRSLGFGLDEAALNAITQWRFTPGSQNGAPVPVQAKIEVNFKLL